MELLSSETLLHLIKIVFYLKVQHAKQLVVEIATPILARQTWKIQFYLFKLNAVVFFYVILIRLIWYVIPVKNQ